MTKRGYPSRARTAAEIFEGRVIRGPGCWGWTGGLAVRGYPQMSVGWPLEKVRSGHRVSWEIHRGPIPAGMHVLHRCDNKACTNPDHLFLGTNADNIADRLRKDRPLTGHAKHPDSAIDAVRALRSRGVGVTEIGRRLGISHSHVSRIVHGLVRRKPRIPVATATREAQTRPADAEPLAF